MGVFFLLINGIVLNLKNKNTLFANFSMLCHKFYKLIK